MTLYGSARHSKALELAWQPSRALGLLSLLGRVNSATDVLEYK